MYRYIIFQGISSVVDPQWVKCGSWSSILGQCGSGYRMLMTKTCTILQLKTKSYCLIKNCNLFILGLHEGRPSYRGSLQPSKKENPALQNMRFLQIFIFFVGHFCRPGSGSRRRKSHRGWSALVSMRIRIYLFTSMRIRIRQTNTDACKFLSDFAVTNIKIGF